MAISLLRLFFAIVFDAAKSSAHKDSAKIQQHRAQKHIHAALYKVLLDYSVFFFISHSVCVSNLHIKDKHKVAKY